MPNSLIEKFVSDCIDQPTVILSFRIILDNVIRNGNTSALSKCDIEQVFNKERKMFGVQTFRRDYVMRQSGNTNKAIGEENELFCIRPNFLEGLTVPEMQSISDEINQHYAGLNKEHANFIDSIKKAKEGDVDSRIKFIIDLLCEIETDRRGQCFEVTSFAILNVFFSNRGFDINRFSTIYSNDGGVDFAAQNAIYQVAVKLNDKKFFEDLDKAPLKKRVMVFKDAVSSFDLTLLQDELILDYITPKDLIEHLNYMASKNPERNTKAILDVILDEFHREYYIANKPKTD